MLAAGIFGPTARLELVDGQLIDVPPQDPRHSSTITSIERALMRAFGLNVVVRTQMPIAAGTHSRPEPDIAIVRDDERLYRDRHPAPADVFGVIEVAWSSLELDRTAKLHGYARAGVPEYWIVNLRAAVVEGYRKPHDLGYATQVEARRGDFIALEAFPDVRIPLDDLLFAAVT